MKCNLLLQKLFRRLRKYAVWWILLSLKSQSTLGYAKNAAEVWTGVPCCRVQAFTSERRPAS